MSDKRMSPEERARGLVPDEWCGTNEERIAWIAAEIRSAEEAAADDALERAALHFDVFAATVGRVKPDLIGTCRWAAEAVRSLKSPGSAR